MVEICNHVAHPGASKRPVRKDRLQLGSKWCTGRKLVVLVYWYLLWSSSMSSRKIFYFSQLWVIWKKKKMKNLDHWFLKIIPTWTSSSTWPVVLDIESRNGSVDPWINGYMSCSSAKSYSMSFWLLCWAFLRVQLQIQYVSVLEVPKTTRIFGDSLGGLTWLIM